MTTPSVPPVPPTRPLTEEQLAAYKDLSGKLEAAIESTTDVAILKVLNASQSKVDAVLTKDAMYRLHANAQLFAAILEQISKTNESLETLKEQTAAIAEHVQQFADILDAIDKVLALVP